MPADLPQERDEEFRGELCIQSFDICRQRHPIFLAAPRIPGLMALPSVLSASAASMLVFGERTAG